MHLTLLFLLILNLLFEFISMTKAMNASRREVIQNYGDKITALISEPIQLGSHLEAYNRIQSLVGKHGIKCIDFEVDGNMYGNCEKYFKIQKVVFDNTKYFGASNIKLDVFFDTSDIIHSIIIDVLFRFFIFAISLSVGFYFFKKRISVLINDFSNLLNKLDSRNETNFSSKILEIHNLEKELNTIFKNEIHLAKQISFNQLAQQVSHDIRSPLSALNMALSSIQVVAEDRRILINNAVQRINEIANDLLLKTKTSVNENPTYNSINSLQKSEHISLIVEQIISEKCIQYRDKMNVKIRADELNSDIGFADINDSDLKRILSNLINNSVEAFKNNDGEVIVSIRTYPEVVQIVVSDNGCGISLENLIRLGEKGFTISKDGNGLGIYHAKKKIENLGGKFNVISKVDVGTTVTITLKRLLVPNGSSEGA